MHHLYPDPINNIVRQLQPFVFFFFFWNNLAQLIIIAKILVVLDLPGGQPNRGAPTGGPPAANPAQIQKILEDNSSLIQQIQEFQSMGKANECMSYHQALHRNLVYLAQLAGNYNL